MSQKMKASQRRKELAKQKLLNRQELEEREIDAFLDKEIANFLKYGAQEIGGPRTLYKMRRERFLKYEREAKRPKTILDKKRRISSFCQPCCPFALLYPNRDKNKPKIFEY